MVKFRSDPRIYQITALSLLLTAGMAWHGFDVKLPCIATLAIALFVFRALYLGDPLAMPLKQMKSGGLLLFAFFMISDPKTTPASHARRMGFAINLLRPHYSLLLAVTFLSFSLPAEAQPQASQEKEESYSYYLISCGTYIEHRQSGKSADNIADTYYIAGWISAYNRLSRTAVISGDMDLDSIMLWLENYCRNAPLSNLEEGLFHLSAELHKAPPPAAAAPSPQPEPGQEPSPKPPKPTPAKKTPPPAPAAPFRTPEPALKPLPY